MWVLTILPSPCDVKRIRNLCQGHTLVQPLPNCFCHILNHSRVMWINVKTCHIHLRGAHHLPLPTLCVGLHPMAQENYHRAQQTGFDVIPDEKFTSLNQPYSLLKPFSPGRKCWTCVGWDGVLISSFCIGSLLKQIHRQQLSRDLMQVWIVISHNFHTSVIESAGEYGQQRLIYKEATFATDFVTSLLTSAFSATSENTKNDFRKVKVWLNLWRSTRIVIKSLFQ